jgi:hypothetical protein
MQNKRDENRKFSQPAFFPKNRKGQDISITTIILVILGIAVLVLLIIGFTKGWNNIAPWLSGSNVETIRTQCQAACATNAQYDFCTATRTIKDGATTVKDVTCNNLVIGKMKDGTVIAGYANYAISACSTIVCPTV